MEPFNLYIGLQMCVNSFLTRKLSNSAKTWQVVKALIIEVYIVANANGSGLFRVNIFVVRLRKINICFIAI